MHGYLTVSATIDELSGYPSRQIPPEGAVIVWGGAVEPNPLNNYPGHIDLWVRHESSAFDDFLTQFSLATSGTVSRIYRLPYSKENHDFLQKLQELLKKGKHVGVSFDPNANSNDFQSAVQRYDVNYGSIKIQK